MLCYTILYYTWYIPGIDMLTLMVFGPRKRDRSNRHVRPHCPFFMLRGMGKNTFKFNQTLPLQQQLTLLLPGTWACWPDLLFRLIYTYVAGMSRFANGSQMHEVLENNAFLDVLRQPVNRNASICMMETLILTYFHNGSTEIHPPSPTACFCGDGTWLRFSQFLISRQYRWVRTRIYADTATRISDTFYS